MIKKFFLLNRSSLMNREMQFMFFRVFILYFKDIFCIHKNYLDKEIFYMLDEYSYYYEFRNSWKKRKD